MSKHKAIVSVRLRDDSDVGARQALQENILNLMKIKTHQNVEYASKAEHRRKFKALNDHFRLKKGLKSMI